MQDEYKSSDGCFTLAQPSPAARLFVPAAAPARLPQAGPAPRSRGGRARRLRQSARGAVLTRGAASISRRSAGVAQQSEPPAARGGRVCPTDPPLICRAAQSSRPARPAPRPTAQVRKSSRGFPAERSAGEAERVRCGAVLLCARPARGLLAGVVAVAFRSVRPRRGRCGGRVRRGRHFVAERWRLLFFFGRGGGAGGEGGAGRGRAPGSYWGRAEAVSAHRLPIGRGRVAQCGIGAGGAESPAGLTRLSPAGPRTHSHERLPRLHREAEPGRQGEGCREVLQGVRPHPRHRPEKGLRLRGECAPSPSPTPLVHTRI